MSLRVLHAPVNIGNQPWALSRHERELGAKSDVVVNYTTWLGYPSDVCLGVAGDKSRRGRLRRALWGLSSPLRYDVLHYYFGRTLMCWDDLGPKAGAPYLDMKIARALGRRIFFTLQGCDVRQAGVSNELHEFTACRPGACGAYDNCAQRYDIDRKRLAEEILVQADACFFLNPDLARFVPGGEFLPYASVDVDAITPVERRAERPTRIVHAPSDVSIKGTTHVRKAIENLARDFDIEYIEVTNTPHEKALEIYRSADLAVDQLLVGWYGAFAVEIMALGIPVLAYVRDSDLACLPGTMGDELGVINVNPANFEQRLRDVLNNRAEWPAWSRRARRYARRWHNPRIIAAALLAAYREPRRGLRLADFVAEGEG